jgi:hypothetical protein
MLEVFWYLQTRSADDAAEFLRFIRSSEYVDLPAMMEYLGGKRGPEVSGLTLGDASGSVVAASTAPASETGTPATDDLEMTDAATDALGAVANVLEQGAGQPSVSETRFTTGNLYPRSEKSDARRFSTLEATKKWRNAYFGSTGVLFYVLGPEQSDRNSAVFGKARKDALIADLVEETTTLEQKTALAEICAMASVGILYTRIAQEVDPPSADMAEYLYATAKDLLDSAISTDPLRAMKLCALLGLYNIAVHATVALAYIGKSLWTSGEVLCTRWLTETCPKSWASVSDVITA